MRTVAAVLSVAAATIHFRVMPEHFGEWWGCGAFFLVCAVAQVLYAMALLRRAGRRLFLFGIVGNLAIVVLWVVRRTVGLPLGPGAGETEVVGVLDLAATAAELALVLILGLLLVRTGYPGGREASVYLLPVAGFAVVLLFLGGLASGTHNRMAMAHQGRTGLSETTTRRDLAACRPPASDSSEAGFTRDMIVHHSQAVEMSEIVRNRTKNPEIRNLADGIILIQQQQIGQMRGWLEAWGLPDAGHGKPMAWMGYPIEHGRMPGMASSKEIIALQEEPPKKMDVQFLRLMIRHHAAALPMARAIVKRSRCPFVRDFAQMVLISQQEEIFEMQGLLEKRNLPPVKGRSSMTMNHMGASGGG